MLLFNMKQKKLFGLVPYLWLKIVLISRIFNLFKYQQTLSFVKFSLFLRKLAQRLKILLIKFLFFLSLLGEKVGRGHVSLKEKPTTTHVSCHVIWWKSGEQIYYNQIMYFFFFFCCVAFISVISKVNTNEFQVNLLACSNLYK